MAKCAVCGADAIRAAMTRDRVSVGLCGGACSAEDSEIGLSVGCECGSMVHFNRFEVREAELHRTQVFLRFEEVVAAHKLARGATVSLPIADAEAIIQHATDQYEDGFVCGMAAVPPSKGPAVKKTLGYRIRIAFPRGYTDGKIYWNNATGTWSSRRESTRFGCRRGARKVRQNMYQRGSSKVVPVFARRRYA